MYTLFQERRFETSIRKYQAFPTIMTEDLGRNLERVEGIAFIQAIMTSSMRSSGRRKPRTGLSPKLLDRVRCRQDMVNCGP